MGLKCPNLMKTHIAKMSVFHLFRIYMKIHDLYRFSRIFMKINGLPDVPVLGFGVIDLDVALRRGRDIRGRDQWSGHEKDPSQKSTDRTGFAGYPAMRLGWKAIQVKTVNKRFPQNMLMIKKQLATSFVIRLNCQPIEAKRVKSNGSKIGQEKRGTKNEG